MRIVCTGQSGLNKAEYLRQVKQLFEEELEICSVGERMQNEHEKAFRKKSDIDQILNLPLPQLCLLRRSVLKDVIYESKNSDNFILDTHAVFRWRWGLFPAFDVDQIEDFDPDFFVTLIDDVDEVQDRLRLRGNQWSEFSLKDIMVWREEEILATDMIARVVGEKKNRHVPNFILARGHNPAVLKKLIVQNDLTKVYLSFGITGLSEQEKSEVRQFRHRMSEHFIAFDPYKIEERGLKITKATVEEEVGSLLQEPPLRDCIGQFEDKFSKRAEGQRTLWEPPQHDTIERKLLESVSINFSKERREREDEISHRKVNRQLALGSLAEIQHDIDGQIILRDFRLIDQSDMVVAYIGLDDDGKPQISAGSQTEIKYASETRRDVFVICKAKDRLSPWVLEWTTNGVNGVFPDVNSAVNWFGSHGYLRL